MTDISVFLNILSKGPTTVGVTWDFSSPSPSQYKKLSHRNSAQQEEETNRIAEQVRTRHSIPSFSAPQLIQYDCFGLTQTKRLSLN